MESVVAREERIARLATERAVRHSGAVESRALTRENLPAVMMASASAGESVSTRSALSIADVFAAVRLLSDVASTLPLIVYRRLGAGRQRVNNQTSELLRAPAPGVTQSSFIGDAMAHWSLWGEIFVGLYRGPGGTVERLGLLAPDHVQVRVEGGRRLYRYTTMMGEVFDDLTTDDVVHVVGFSLDGLRGASPVAMCRQSLGLAKALSEQASAFMQNGASPHGLLSVPPGPAAAEAAESLAAAWRDRHRGPQRAGTVGVLTGDVSFTPLSMPPGDAEFVAQRELSTREIARIFRVPASLIGASSGDSLTYATSETESLGFVKFSLAPALTAIEQALSAVRELFPPDFYCEFLLDAVLRADSATRAGVYSQGLAGGWLVVNDVRRAENLSPLPGGDAPRADQTPAPDPLGVTHA